MIRSVTMAPRETDTPRTARRDLGHTLRRRIVLATGVLMLLSALAAWRFLPYALPQDSAAAVERLVQRCEADMLRGICRVQGGPTSASPQDTVVFVAGVGAIDAASYVRLRDAGEQLCVTVRQTCAVDWNGQGCRAARALHGEP